MELVARVLAMHVAKRVVRVALVVEHSDTSPLEARRETELPPERRLDVASERPRRSAVRRHHRMEVIVGGAERQETARVALREHDARDKPKRSRGGCDGAIVLEPERDVKSDRRRGSTAIREGGIETIVGRELVEAMSDR